MKGARVAFRCPICPGVLWLRPSEAARRKVCSRACRNTARFHSKQQQINRLKRVMFVYGFTRDQALAYLRGWKDGRSAATLAYRRGRRLTDQKVGSVEWERGRPKSA